MHVMFLYIHSSCVGATAEDPNFGAELDYPLFYVAPVVEMSEDPHLPVYSLAVAPGSSSR